MISGYTRVAAVIGDPVKHSLSPEILNRAFSAASLDWCYVAFEVSKGNAVATLEAMETLGLGGLSVTMPHKHDIARAVPNMTPAAAALGAVNCVYRQDGELWGDSTDGDGFVASVASMFGSNFEGTRVLVVGTGGAAKSIVEAFGRSTAAELFVAGRSVSKAGLVAALAPNATPLATDMVIDVLGQSNKKVGAAADLIVQATSVGMDGTDMAGHSPLPAEVLHSGQVVVDVIYQPRVTPLLKMAEEVGAQTVNGVPMLIHQAALAFQRWTGSKPPLEVMLSVLK